MTIDGSCDPRFAGVRDAFRRNFADGWDHGGAVALMVDGRTVVDLWGGHADLERTRAWERDTVVVVNSATKIPLNICVLMLVDRGLIALDEPVATYWPAFAAGGKAKVTIRDVLTYQAGVPALDPRPAFEDFFDWDKITARVAAEPHWFGGERRIAYTPVNTGYILGEVMRRVDGRMPDQFLNEEICGPADIDFQIGIREPSTLERVASTGLLDPPTSWAFPNPLAEKISMCVPEGDWSPWERLHAQMPSANGFTNGRALARLGAIVAGGGVLDGRRYLSEAMARELVTPQAEGEEPIFQHMRVGLGFSLHADFFPLPSETCAYWGGRGGTSCVMDPRTGLSVGYTINNFIVAFHGQDPRNLRLWAAISEVLDELEAETVA